MALAAGILGGFAVLGVMLAVAAALESRWQRRHGA